jgi:hypothetical protein
MIRFVLAMLFAFTLPASPVLSCKDGRLEVKVVDCQDEPVENAALTVKCKSGGEVSARTNKEGIAVLEVDPKDVSGVDVTAMTLEALSTTCPESPCTIKVCFPGDQQGTRGKPCGQA